MLKAHIILCIMNSFFDREDTLDECKMMGAMYVQAIVDSLNERSPDLPAFNASKLFIPKYYLSDVEVHKASYVRAMVGEIDYKIWIGRG